MKPELSFNNVAIGRWMFNSNLHFFDLNVFNEGIGGNFMWKQMNVRIPGIAVITDFQKRQKYKSLSFEDQVKMNDYNFFVTWEQIQGVVSYRVNKEFKIRTTDEIITILFRSPAEFDLLLDRLNNHIKEKIFSRDIEKMKQSVFEGMDKVPEDQLAFR